MYTMQILQVQVGCCSAGHIVFHLKAGRGVMEERRQERQASSLGVTIPSLRETSDGENWEGKDLPSTGPSACDKFCCLWGPGRAAGGTEGGPSAGRPMGRQAGVEAFVLPERCQVAGSVNQC